MLSNSFIVFARMGEINEAQECLQKMIKDFEQNEDVEINHMVDCHENGSKNITENSALLHLNLCALFSQQAR